ncbi:NADH dehydrogenase, partial [Actinomyces oris]
GAAGTVMRRPVLLLLGLGLAGALTAVVWRSTLPTPVGLKNGAKAAPDLLAVTLYHDHVVTMELTAILLIVAAVGALTLTHRQRIRARLSQRGVAASKMQDYTTKGAHPGQKPMPGVYASTNSAAAPALDAEGEAVEESVPRVLRARGQGLELSDVSPEMGLAQRSGTIVARLAGAGDTGAADGPRTARRSGMPTMPGAAAPAVKQPVLSDDGAADSAAPEQKEEK